MSRPPKTALERRDLTEKFQFRESHAEAETKKLLTAKKENGHIKTILIVFALRQ